MRVQDEKIKGFNVLELIIVIAIIGVLSAVAYPNFSDWRKDRETRNSVVKIKSLIEGINAQVQRGQYAFVQVDVEEDKEDDGLIVTSKGMKPKTLATLLNNGESGWWVRPNERCNIVDEAYWDEDPDPDRNQIIDLDKIEVRQIVLDNVATTWRDKIGAVCFGKNDQWYSGNGELVSSSGDDVIVDSYLFICNRSNTRSQCDIDNVTGEPTTEHDHLYVIEWSRFGNIKLEKWNKRDAEWIEQ
ncbi:prepilin-type N-terminal cleavage/methylation domain-containing protein [Candidatus Pelagibacter ubique]|jgi:prepilin-type N-terminal cleavage/methylation domain-containing protein|nr:prepilin-type N-terminal cleavage/methylation domain-containing protein [Candidatus Pelagibacter ubique]